MGSAVYAKSLVTEQVQVKIMLSLEMIGFFSDAAGSQHYPMPLLSWFYPARGDFIAVVGDLFEVSKVRNIKAQMRAASDLPVYSINAPALVPGVDFSDHLNFCAAGYPAVMITDTAFFRNMEYHHPGDTYERLDYARMARVLLGVYAVIVDMAK